LVVSTRRCTEGWARLESLFNGLIGDRPIWFVCPYDTRTVSEEALATARRTHPTIATASARTPSPEYFAGGDLAAPVAPAGDAESTETSSAIATSVEELGELRSAVLWPAGRAGHLFPTVAQDLALAVTELARAALASDAGAVTMRTAQTNGSWFCELAFARGSASALIAGAGRVGFIIGRVVCDRVEFADDGAGGLVRFVFTPAKRPPRERIVAAADELFRQNGIRATGVNEIVAGAGVAKATFYANFQGKSDLIAEWYWAVTASWLDWMREEVAARTEAPAGRLTTFFEVLHDWMAIDFADGGGRVMLSAELRDPRHPARLQRRPVRNGVTDYFRAAAADAGLADPEHVAGGLTLLLQGAIDQAVEQRSPAPALAARVAAEHLVAAAGRAA
jgi:AcrR family transcriptional regulator